MQAAHKPKQSKHHRLISLRSKAPRERGEARLPLPLTVRLAKQVKDAGRERAARRSEQAVEI